MEVQSESAKCARLLADQKETNVSTPLTPPPPAPTPRKSSFIDSDYDSDEGSDKEPPTKALPKSRKWRVDFISLAEKGATKS